MIFHCMAFVKGFDHDLTRIIVFDILDDTHASIPSSLLVARRLRNISHSFEPISCSIDEIYVSK